MDSHDSNTTNTINNDNDNSSLLNDRPTKLSRRGDSTSRRHGSSSRHQQQSHLDHHDQDVSPPPLPQYSRNNSSNAVIGGGGGSSRSRSRRALVFDTVPPLSQASAQQIDHTVDPSLLPSSTSTLGFEATHTIPETIRATPPKKSFSNTLFGAVMKNSGCHASTTATTTFSAAATTGAATATPVLPKKTTTPSPANNFTSPGGIHLMNFINQVTSPFTFIRRSLTMTTPQSTSTSSSNSNTNGCTTPNLDGGKHRSKYQTPSSTGTTSTPTTTTHRTPLPTKTCQSTALKNGVTSDVVANAMAETPRHLREWHSACYHEREVQVLDWALKSNLRFQCYPHCPLPYPGVMSIQSLQLFMQPGKTVLGAIPQNEEPTHAHANHNKTDYRAIRQQQTESAIQLWNAALLYWQYPSTTRSTDGTIATTRMKEGTNQSMMNTKTTRRRSTMGMMAPQHSQDGTEENSRLGMTLHSQSMSNDSIAPSSLFLSSRRSHSRLQPSSLSDSTMPPPLAKNGLDFSQVISPSGSREREWQEAFRSLYLLWLQRIQGSKHESDRLNVYFYAVADDHVVLFRMSCGATNAKAKGESTLDGNRDELDYSSRHPWAKPEIVVSTMGQDVRDQLRSMGVCWKLLERYGSVTKAPFHEKEPTNHPNGNSKKNDKLSVGLSMTTLNDSPTVQDLIALKRAQATGKTAGADVSFQIRRPIQGTEQQQFQTQSPLYLEGWDDCLAFCEVYFNRIGQLSQNTASDLRRANKTVMPPRDPPVLLCRNLGPFLHASLKTLEWKNPAQSGERFGNEARISGIILPCAARSLMGTMIQLMHIESQVGDTTDGIHLMPRDGGGGNPAPDARESERPTGSHHIIVQLQTHEQQQAHKVRPGKVMVGDCSSKFFNVQTRHVAALVDDECMLFELCRYQELLQTIVWDSNQLNDVAYKVEHI